VGEIVDLTVLAGVAFGLLISIPVVAYRHRTLVFQHDAAPIAVRRLHVRKRDKSGYASAHAFKVPRGVKDYFLMSVVVGLGAAALVVIQPSPSLGLAIEFFILAFGIMTAPLGLVVLIAMLISVTSRQFHRPTLVKRIRAGLRMKRRWGKWSRNMSAADEYLIRKGFVMCPNCNSPVDPSLSECPVCSERVRWAGAY
jgi:hypothetical protein